MSSRFIPLRPNLPILDAVEGVRLRVTEAMCDKATPGDPKNCALALAAKAEMRGLQQVQVFTNVAYFEFRDRVERYRNAARTADMIRRFDASDGSEFEPGDYRFLPMNPAWTLEAIREKNSVYGRPTSGEKPTAGRRQMQTVFIRPRGADLSSSVSSLREKKAS